MVYRRPKRQPAELPAALPRQAAPPPAAVPLTLSAAGAGLVAVIVLLSLVIILGLAGLVVVRLQRAQPSAAPATVSKPGKPLYLYPALNTIKNALPTTKHKVQVDEDK